LNEKEILSKLSTDPIVYQMERLRTDRLPVRRSSHHNRWERFVPITCATLGLLLLTPSAISLAAPGEGLPISPEKVITEDEEIKQPEKPKKEFRLEYQFKKIKERSEKRAEKIEAIIKEKRNDEEDKLSEEKKDDQNNLAVGDNPIQEVSPVQEEQSTKRQEQPTDQDRREQLDQKKQHNPETTKKIKTSTTNLISQDPVPTSKSTVMVGTKSEKANAEASATNNVTQNEIATDVNKTTEQPKTQNGTSLPKTAGKHPERAMAGLGVALLGLAWKLRNHGKVKTN
jgi:hypothetical protein